MKQILLLRHAKSSWEFPQLADHDRPLNERGQEAAGRMGAHIEESDIPLDLIVTSPAVRARETADRVKAALSRPPRLDVDSRLYLHGKHEILELLREVDADCSGVMLVGHNPVLQEFAVCLSDSDGTPEIAAIHAKFPTCALAQFEADIDDWRELEFHAARLLAYTPVKSLT